MFISEKISLLIDQVKLSQIFLSCAIFEWQAYLNYLSHSTMLGGYRVINIFYFGNEQVFFMFINIFIYSGLVILLLGFGWRYNIDSSSTLIDTIGK